MRRDTGFTLIELMIVVAIVGILASIALPAYTQYVISGRLVEAGATLSGHRVKMEQFFQDNRTYVGACAAGTVATVPPATDNFTYACNPAPTATTYTLTATGNAGTSVNGFTLAINETNTRTTVAVPAGWTAPGANCWIRKKSGEC